MHPIYGYDYRKAISFVPCVLSRRSIGGGVVGNPRTSVVGTRDATRLRETGLDALQLGLGEPELIRHWRILLPCLNHDAKFSGIRFHQDRLCGESYRWT
jgi:hypothetical protein